MQFLIVSRRKSQEFFPTASFFSVLYMIVYQNVLIPRKLLCSKTFLVTHLGWLLLLFALVNIYLYMEQKQLSSHTKIKKKFASVLHPAFFFFFFFFFFAHFRNQTTRKTDDEHGFIAQHKLNKIKGLNIQQFPPYLAYRWEKKLFPLRWVAKTL